MTDDVALPDVPRCPHQEAVSWRPDDNVVACRRCGQIFVARNDHVSHLVLTELRVAIGDLEAEAFRHGLRNGKPPKAKGTFKPPAGERHATQRERVKHLLDTLDGAEFA